MAGRFFDYDPVTGITETFHKTDKGFVIQTSQDVEKTLDFAKYMRAEDTGHYRDANYHPVAAIPYVLIQKWTDELGDNPLAKHNRKWLIAKLNDPDNKFLRLKGGKL